MAQNRWLPYGYKVENGKTAINEQESEIIRRIFKSYANGESYKKIAEALTATGVTYMQDKPAWNKNMVARILQNKSYLGTDRYPPILMPAEFAAAEQAQKPYNLTEPTDIKQLKGLFVCGVCGKPLGRRIKTGGGERWHCPMHCNHISTAVTDALLLKNIHSLLEKLPQTLNQSAEESQRLITLNTSITKLANEIGSMLDREISNESAIKELMLRLAQAKYDAIDDNAAVTKQMREQLRTAAPDTEMLCGMARKIIIGTDGTVSIELKNNLLLTERGDSDEQSE